MNGIIKIAKEVIRIEAETVSNLEESINADFEKSVENIYKSKGRLIVTGIGKSAIIAQKIVATMNSTGTPAIFMHAADAIHGDLGIIQSDDIVLCISNSGNTPEIKLLIPLIKDRNNILIGMTSNEDSFLSKNCDYTLMTRVEKEACPNNLAPTSSTTAQMVIGDALAISLIEAKGFTQDDFAKYHPGGALGKKMYLRVEDLSAYNDKPEVSKSAGIREIILEISSKRLGATAVIEDGKVIGIITDGDLRRMMQNHKDVDGLRALDIMSKNPKTISKNMLAVDALKLMKSNNITQLLITDEGLYSGVVHLHDILKEGIL